ncbi:MAG: hypothetical protein GKR94_12435 [Gammaproteobacteria bacterium]|nr:hypothetical protein [Gammaproteobacteria bacterium]
MIEVRLTNTGLREQRHRAGEPVRCGVPLPRGWCDGARAWLRVQAHDGTQRASQTRIIKRWPDGSARWVLVDWLLSEEDGGQFELYKGDAPPADENWYRRSGDDLTVVTRNARYRLTAGATFPVVSIEGCRWPRPMRPNLSLSFASANTPVTIRCEALQLIDAGPVCLTVKARAQIAAPGKAPLVCVVRLTFYRESAAVGATVALTNPNAAEHPGGIWELGDSGSVLLREFSFNVATDGQARGAQLRLGENDAVLHHGSRLGVHQESSGGERWDSPNHLNRNAQLTLRYRGFKAVAGEAVTAGNRAQPVLQLNGAQEARFALAARYFWQNFPRGLHFEDGGARLALFPADCADAHELQGGERKTHEWWWAVDADEPYSLAWVADPAVLHVATDWIESAKAVPYIKRGVFDESYRFYLDRMIAGDESFEAKRERIDEYGWRNFGDINADHEAAFHTSEEPYISHYNNQYDAVYSFGAHFLCSGDIPIAIENANIEYLY